MVIIIVADVLAFVLMHTQKNESQEYQIFGREFGHKIEVCVYTLLYVEKFINYFDFLCPLWFFPPHPQLALDKQMYLHQHKFQVAHRTSDALHIYHYS